MKEITGNLWGILTGALVMLFVLWELFGNQGAMRLAQLGKDVVLHYQQQEHTTENFSRMREITDMECPEIQMKSEVCKVGTVWNLWAAVEVEGADGIWRTIEESDGYGMELLDMRDSHGNRIGEELFCGVEASGEILGPVGYDRYTGQICFYENGIYQLKLKVTGPYGRSVIRQVHIPVSQG